MSPLLPSVLVLSSTPGIPLYGPSGASAHLRGIIRAFLHVGIPLRVAIPRLHGPQIAVDDPLEAAISTFPPRNWRWMRRWRERGELWDARKLVEVSLAEYGRPEWVYERHAMLCDAGQRLGLPRVVELNAPLVRERARYARLFDGRYCEHKERDSLRSADRVNAVSGWLARWAVEEMGCDPARVRHIPNGVEDRPPGDRDSTRRSLGLDGPVIGFLGTMKPWHGVEAIPAILDLLPDFTAILLGDGPMDPPRHPRMRALGRVDPARVPDHVAAMDVALAPYRQDAAPWFCPLKILDYRAQGVPVVAADVGDCAHLLADGGGEVVRGDDPSAWAAAILRQMEAPRRPMLRSWHAVLREALAGLEVNGTVIGLPSSPDGGGG